MKVKAFASAAAVVLLGAASVAASRAIGSMSSQFLNVHIRELRFALMDGHRIVETTEILVLNAGNRWVTDKIMLGNVFDLDGG